MKKKQIANKQRDRLDIDLFETIVKSLFFGENKSKVAIREALNTVFVFDNKDKEKYLEDVSNAMKLLEVEKCEVMIVRDYESNAYVYSIGDTHYIQTRWAMQASYLYDILSKIYKNPDTDIALYANGVWAYSKNAKPVKEVEKSENAFDGDKFEKAISITISDDYSLFGQFDGIFAQGIEQAIFSERLNQVEQYIFTKINKIENGYAAIRHGLGGFDRFDVDAATMDYNGRAYWSVLGELMKMGSKDKKAIQQARQIWKAKRSLLEKQQGRSI